MKTPLILLAAAALGLGGYATSTSAQPYGAEQGAAMVTAGDKAPYGTFLVDARGRSLYILEGTRGTAGSRCSGECLRVWPPLHSSGPVTVGAGIDPALLATAVAHDGPHVTYAGWPLYYYHHDRAPLDTTGQHVVDRWGTWHLLSPSGEPIRPAGSY
jgi:predicted lipoprotein with Yx(FWY)xxD motif